METIVLGFSTLLEPGVLAFLLLGVFCGLIVGSIPGLNENIAFAVFIPFSFSLAPVYALALMVGVYCAAAVGGAMPAVMIKVPGTASAVLTAIDGNAMVRRGHANKALGIAIFSSVFGGLSSALVLLFFAPVLAGLPCALVMSKLLPVCVGACSGCRDAGKECDQGGSVRVLRFAGCNRWLEPGHGVSALYVRNDQLF